MGFACAFLLGLLLWSLTSATLGNPALVAEAAGAEITGSLNQPAPAEESEAGARPSTAGAQSSAHGMGTTMVVNNSTLSAAFTPEVRFWEPQIKLWAAEHGLDPNLVATVMQIESCGNPQAVSRAGARGLFQVMPFHFAAGEDMLDPDSNAARGMAYLSGSLEKAAGDVGLALAGYNGGHGAIGRAFNTWPAETQRYYRWGGGIYAEVSSGMEASSTLNEWLAAGGASLCAQAAAQLGLR